MFYLSRRQTKAALSAAAGAAVYLAASEIGKDKLKMTGLFVVASASMAGMVTAKASAKAYSAHQRIDTLVPIVAGVQTSVAGKYDKTGGAISGTVNMSSNDITNIAHIAPAQIGPGGTRANFSYSPDSHNASAPGSYDVAYTNANNNRVSHLIDQVSAVSDRCDYILGTLLTSANVSY